MTASDHPRARGEHQDETYTSATRCGSSPRTRGTQSEDDQGNDQPRIIPAHAGNTDILRPQSVPRADHPRARGEHPCARFQGVSFFGSSPRTRGTLGVGGAGGKGVDIIPAHAGNTPSNFRCLDGSADHPRARGEHRDRIPPKLLNSDHPRARGEHEVVSGALAKITGSSPRTRGTPHPEARTQAPRRIIPAHAGNTPSPPLHCAREADHPRARGEHVCGGRAHRANFGSSPRTRGTRGVAAQAVYS